MAAKVNEAKEIVLGEKAAREGGEDDEEEASWEDELTEEEKIKKKREEMRKASELFDSTTPAPEPLHPDQGPLSEHPAAPFFTWKRTPKGTPPTMVAPTSYWNTKEDLFHRKATRTEPHWKPYDNTDIFPREKWKEEYLADMQNLMRQQEQDTRKAGKWVRDGYTNEGAPLGHFEDVDGKTMDPRTFTHTEERRAAEEAREMRRDREHLNILKRSLNVRTARRMAEVRAEARHAADRYRKSVKENSM